MKFASAAFALPISGVTLLSAVQTKKTQLAMSIDRLDTDGDGFVSRDEISAAREHLFERLDANGDGNLDADEIEAWRDAIMDHAVAMQSRLGSHWRGMDASGDGGLSARVSRPDPAVQSDRSGRRRPTLTDRVLRHLQPSRWPSGLTRVLFPILLLKGFHDEARAHTRPSRTWPACGSRNGLRQCNQMEPRHRHGGRITRSISGDGLIYSGQTTRTGPDGGTYTSTATCLNGVVDRCRRGYSATGPAGQAIAGHRASARGPFRVRSAGSFTAPRGNTLIGVHRRWR